MKWACGGRVILPVPRGRAHPASAGIARSDWLTPLCAIDLTDGRQEMMLDGVLHELRVVLQSHLRQQARAVRADRSHAQIELGGDIPWGLARRDQAEDLKTRDRNSRALAMNARSRAASGRDRRPRSPGARSGIALSSNRFVSRSPARISNRSSTTFAKLIMRPLTYQHGQSSVPTEKSSLATLKAESRQE